MFENDADLSKMLVTLLVYEMFDFLLYLLIYLIFFFRFGIEYFLFDLSKLFVTYLMASTASAITHWHYSMLQDLFVLN